MAVVFSAAALACSAPESSQSIGADGTGEFQLLPGEVSLWNDTTVPAIPAAADTAAVELGVKFRTDVDGTINGIRVSLRAR